jgi:hypothetical protein
VPPLKEGNRPCKEERPLTAGVAVGPHELEGLEGPAAHGVLGRLHVLLIAAHGGQEAGGAVGVAGDGLRRAGGVADLEDVALVGLQAKELDAAAGAVV